MISDLVPSNHRKREHALAEALAPLREISSGAIEQVWDAWRCPPALLAFQAYALSVDFWDDGWDEIRKRRAIAESPAYHRRKGTRAAVEDAAGYTQRGATIIEWWQFSPARRRGTFSVTIHLAEHETAFPAGEIALLHRLVSAAKPKSRAFTILAGHLVDFGVSVGVGLATGGGALLMVPAEDPEITFNPAVYLMSGAGASLEVQ